MIEVNPWRYVAASAQGSSHVQSGTPCQDFSLAQFVETANGDIMLLAVSDGAGSAQHSQIGSMLACQEFVAQAQHFFDSGKLLSDLSRETMREWLEFLAARISLYAQTMDLSIREFACTFLAVLIGPTCGVFVQIGDGAIVVHGKDGYEAVFWPQSGEYVNTTSFLTDSKNRDEMNFALQDLEIEEVALFSDGLQMLAINYQQKKPHAPFFDGLFPQLRKQAIGEATELVSQLRDYLSSPAINARTDDDKSLVLATRKQIQEAA